jgi:hypothetical protein
MAPPTFEIPLQGNDAASHRSTGTLHLYGTATGKGILIGLLSALGSAIVVFVILSIVFFFRYTQQGRIFLDRIGRPGEFDDEAAFAKEEEEALERMNDGERLEYLRAKGKFLHSAPTSVYHLPEFK